MQRVLIVLMDFSYPKYSTASSGTSSNIFFLHKTFFQLRWLVITGFEHMVLKYGARVIRL